MPSKNALAEINKSLTDVLKLYDVQKQKLEDLEKKTEEHSKLSIEIEKIENQIKELVEAKRGGESQENAEYKDILEKYGELKGMIEGLAKIQQKFGEYHIPGFCDQKNELKKFSLLKYTLAATGVVSSWDGAGHEKEVYDVLKNKPGADDVHGDIMRYAAGDGPARGLGDARGGFMFPDGVMDELIVSFLPQSLLGMLGITVIDDMGRNKSLSVPKMTSQSIGTWIGEGVTIEEGETAFGTVTLNPHKFAGRLPITAEALMSITPKQEMIFRDRITQEFQRAGSIALLMGNGTGGAWGGNTNAAQPRGIFYDDSIPATHRSAWNEGPIGKGGNPGVAGKKLNLQIFKYLKRVLNAANVTHLPSMKWLMSDDLCDDLIWTPTYMFSGQGDDDKPMYPFLQQMQSGNKISMSGWPIIANNYMPDDFSQDAAGVLSKDTYASAGPNIRVTKRATGSLTGMILAAWAEIMMAIWRTMSIMYNPFSSDAWTKDMVDMRLIVEMDFQNRRPDSVSYYTGIALSG